MRGPAAEAVSGRVRRPHTTSTALRIRFFEELVQFKDPTVCLGHDLGATGDEVITQHFAPVQIQGKAGSRQLKNPRIGMTHNLGGAPRENISSVAIVGRYE